LSGLLSVVTLIAGLVSTAHADPISDEQANATAIQDSIEANGERISALSEQYDGAQLRLQQAEDAAASAEVQIAADQAGIVEIRNAIGTRARDVYERAAAGESLASLDLRDAQQLLTGRRYADAVTHQEHRQLADLNAATADLTRTHDQAKAAVQAAAADATLIDQTAQQLQDANQQQYATLAQVQGTLQQLVAQDQARREAHNLATAQTHYGTGSNLSATTGAATSPGVNTPSRGAPSAGASSVGGSAATPPSWSPPRSTAPAPTPSHVAVPTGGSVAAVAIAFARAQLGKPYRYAAAGPNAYDCSGLTMAAWGAAGVRLPHYSGAQYSMLPHVSLAAMVPGDLIFWGPGGSQHVGLYIGGGLMIAAPTTGEVVKIQAIWGHPIGAARP
jgi:cell wall-associated NlpC family hydrolase